MVKDNTRQRKQSTRDLWSMVWYGLGLQVLGGLIAGLSWPGTDVKPSGRAVGTGSAAGAWIGVTIASLGSMLMLVVLVAFGVVLGLRARAMEAR